MVLERTLENSLECKEIKRVNPKGNQSWIFIGRTDAEAETPIFWPSDAKNRLIGRKPDAGKDWRHEEKGITEDEMVEWHHQLNGHKFEQALGVGQGSLACCSPWFCKESDTIERLNWTELKAVKNFKCIYLSKKQTNKKQTQNPHNAGTNPRTSNSVEWGWSLRICISNRFLIDADAAGSIGHSLWVSYLEPLKYSS